MRAILVNFLYLIGAAVMFYPAISGKVYLSAICIPVGITICTFSLVLPQSKGSELNYDILDSHLVDNHKFQIWNSDKKVEEFSKIIREETWDKGIPMVYMNKYGQVVRHWKDGTIEIIKDLGDEAKN